MDSFDSADAWLKEPIVAFESWLGQKSYRKSTKIVYIAMFKQFVTWCEERNTPLLYVESHHIGGFLDTIGAEKEYRYSYIRLIERVWTHLGTFELVVGNPGRQAKIEKVGIGVNDNAQFLDDDQRQSLIAWCENQVEVCLEKDGQEDGFWVYMRDAALIALLYGGGIKVGRLKGCGVNCTDGRNGLIVPGRGLGRDREYRALLQPFAADILRRWQVMHRALHLPANCLIPADPQRKTLQAKAKTAHLSPSSIYRRVNTALAACGVTGKRACPQTLRNSYAADLIDTGVDDAQIVMHMGFIDADSLKDFKRQYLLWQKATAQRANSDARHTPSE